MTQDPNNENIIRCSCRSIQNVNIHEILSNHKECFEGFGGHKMAAGFSFDKTKYSFEQIKEKASLSEEIEAFDSVDDFVDDFVARMTRLFPDGAKQAQQQSVQTSTLDYLYANFELFDLGWNIVEPL